MPLWFRIVLPTVVGVVGSASSVLVYLSICYGSSQEADAYLVGDNKIQVTEKKSYYSYDNLSSSDRAIIFCGGASEGFYHGMMLGLCAILGKRYRIRSNIESGDGRFDIELAPISQAFPGFLLEFKKAEDEPHLQEAAIEALSQIQEKRYDTHLKSLGVTKIIRTGIAFFGKKAALKSL